MPIPSWAIKYLAGGLVIAILMAFAWYRGYSGQHDLLLRERATVAQMGKDQAAATKAYEAKIRESANAAEKNTQIATNSIADYYRKHPVIRLRNNNGSCTLSQADSNSKGANGSTSSGNATAYISPYRPDKTEQVASRLYQLQQLLIKDGVTVK